MFLLWASVPDMRNLFRTHAGDHAAPGCFCMPHGNLRQVRGILSLSKHHFRHAAPDVPAQIDTGKIPDMFEAKPFNHPGCFIKGALTILVA